MVVAYEVPDFPSAQAKHWSKSKTPVVICGYLPLRGPVLETWPRFGNRVYLFSRLSSCKNVLKDNVSHDLERFVSRKKSFILRI
jgi:hypothetical protein